MFFQIKGQQKFLAWEEHHVFLHIPSQKQQFIFCINMCVYIKSPCTVHPTQKFLWCLAKLKVTQKKIMSWEIPGNHSNRQGDPSSLQQKHMAGEHHALADFLFHISDHIVQQGTIAKKESVGKGNMEQISLCSLENIQYCCLQEYMGQQFGFEIERSNFA